MDTTDTTTDDTMSQLAQLRDTLGFKHGIEVSGPHPVCGYRAHPDSPHLVLADGRHIHVEVDSNDVAQALIYTEPTLTAMMDPSGQDWPGDPV